MKQNTSLANILLILLYLLTILLTIAWGLCRPAENGLRGDYYGNAGWDDAPVLTVVDAVPSADTLKSQRSRLKQQLLSIEWSGYVKIPVAGLHTFFTDSDDGSFLFIDDVLVVDNGGAHGLQERQGVIFLRPGFHRIRIRYFDVGGYAVMRVFWQLAGMEKERLPSRALIPPISITQLWISQKVVAVSPVIGALWGIALLACLLASHRYLRRRPHSRYTVAAVWSPTSLQTLFSHSAQRLLGMPLSFVGQQLAQAYVWYWMLVAFYTALIFFTLSYARTFSTIIITRYGDGMFSSITLLTLVTAGCGVIAYLCVLREKLFSRLVVFAAIGVLYAYVLSPEFRETVHEWTILIGYTGEFLQSLRIYPGVNSEKMHFLEYGLLGLLLCKALSFHIKDKLAYPLAVVGVYCIGLLDEGVQWALPNRVGEFRDIGINLLAGTLTIILVALALRPRVFRPYARWRSLRVLCGLLTVALLLTGIFFQAVHRFGVPIVLPAGNIRFTSVFPEGTLAHIDDNRAKRQTGVFAEELSALDLRYFDYEAGRHVFARDWYYQRKYYWESYCEQEILRIYYHSYLQQRNIDLLTYKPDLFVILPEHSARGYFDSPTQQLAVVAFSSRKMWQSIWFAGLLCMLAVLRQPQKI